MTLIEALTLVMSPGEDVGYSELLRWLNRQAPSFSTAGFGVAIGPLAFRGYTGGWRGSEFVTYRVPYFDRELAGDWTEGELRIVRREAEDEDA